MKKVISVFLAVILSFLTATTIFAASPLGDEYVSYSQNLSENLTYTEIHAKNQSGKQSGYQFTLDPRGDTKAVVSYGSHIYSRETLSSLLKISASRESGVLGGISGDVFAIQSGVQCGVMVSDGVILSSNEDNCPSVGIKKDGTLVCGTPTVNISVKAGGFAPSVKLYNKVTDSSTGPCLLTSDFASTTKSICDCVVILIKPSTTIKMTQGTNINGTVSSVETGDGNIIIPTGYAALCVPKSSSYATAASKVAVGTSCNISVSLSSEWADAQFIISGETEILKNGTVQTSVDSTAYKKSNDARAAAGVTSDGKITFFACDGDGSYGVGLTERQLSEYMKSIGCVYAVSLASGSSTGASLYEDGLPGFVSHPSLGYERTISNAVVFINSSNNKTSDRLSVSADYNLVIKGGGRTKLYAKAANSAGKETGEEITDLKFTLSGGGSLSGSTYISDKAGTVTVNASALCNGKILTGKLVLTVVNSLDSIKANKTWYNVALNGYEEIKITGYTSSIPTGLTASAIKWTYSGAAEQDAKGQVSACQYGYLDSSFIFHSNGKVGTFVLTGTYGYQSVSMTMRMTKEPVTVSGFNSGRAFSNFFDCNPDYTYRYDVGKNGTTGMYFVGNEIKYITPLEIGNTVKNITVWTKGTASSPYAVLEREDGSIFTVNYETDIDYSSYSGWKRLKADMPSGETGNLRLISCLSSKSTIYAVIDNVKVDYGSEGYIFCDTSGNWAKSKIDMMYDLDILSGTVIDSQRYYYPQNNLTRAEFAKIIVSYYRIDTSKYENIKLDFIDEAQIPSWAQKYVKAAIGSGLMSGSNDKTGLRHFYPQNSITRAEVMSVIGRKLTNTGATLNFSDASEIPSWALSSVQKTVSAKIVSGYPDGTLKPLSNVTRAEIAAIIYNLYRYQYS